MRGRISGGRASDTDALAARATPQYSIVNRTEKCVNLWLNAMKILICADEQMLYAHTRTARRRPDRAYAYMNGLLCATTGNVGICMDAR